MNDNGHAEPAQQEVAVPEAEEVVTIPNALMGVAAAPGGHALLFFQTRSGRRYQFPLDAEGRQLLGGKLLAGTVPVFGPGDMPPPG